MLPIFESKGDVTSSKSNQFELDDHEAEKGGGASSSLLKDANSTTGSHQIHKVAYDNSKIRHVKYKKPSNDKNDQEDQENVDHSIIRTSSSDSEKCYPQGIKIEESHTHSDKLKVHKKEQKQSEVHSFNDDVIADSQSDVKATAKMDIPPELLEFAYFNDPEETVQGITKFSEDGEDSSKEDDSANKNDEDGGDDDADPPEIETANQTATSEQSAVETHYGRQDSNAPMGEADECLSPVAKAEFVIGVASITKITQFKGFERKNSCLPANNLTDFVSMNSASISPNDNLLDGVPKEEQTQHNNDSSEFIVSKLELGATNSTCGVTTLLTVENVEKLQGNPLYAYFSAPFGATGDNPVSTYRDEDDDDYDDDDDDAITLEASVSDNDSFKSGPADAFDPDV